MGVREVTIVTTPIDRRKVDALTRHVAYVRQQVAGVLAQEAGLQVRWSTTSDTLDCRISGPVPDIRRLLDALYEMGLCGFSVVGLEKHVGTLADGAHPAVSDTTITRRAR